MRSVVICDDDPIVRRVIAQMCADASFEVVGQSGLAIEASDLVANHQADVLIVDMSLPGMSGLEVADEVRRRSRDTAVVLLSSFEITDADVERAGAVAAIDKSRLGELDPLLHRLAASFDSRPA